jgi:hypothetical protein
MVNSLLSCIIRMCTVGHQQRDPAVSFALLLSKDPWRVPQAFRSLLAYRHTYIYLYLRASPSAAGPYS